MQGLFVIDSEESILTITRLAVVASRSIEAFGGGVTFVEAGDFTFINIYKYSKASLT